jgi:cation:H+ antiporter
MIALGTSLPELSTALASIRKGHSEITLGNIVRTDVLNCLFVIGAAATAKPLSIPSIFYSLHFPAIWYQHYISRHRLVRQRRAKADAAP